MISDECSLLVDVPAVADRQDLDPASGILNRENDPVIANTQALAGPRFELFAACRSWAFGQYGQFAGYAKLNRWRKVPKFPFR
jgi:hypothetical protein